MIPSVYVHHFFNMSAYTNNDMNLSNRTVKGFFKFGRRTTDAIEFNDKTNMADIQYYIYESFSDVVPSAFHVEFYGVEAKKVIHLDEDILKSPDNPFLDSQNNENVMNWVALLIVDDSSPEDRLNLRSSMYNGFLNKLHIFSFFQTF
jgi:hypothetical protein